MKINKPILNEIRDDDRIKDAINRVLRVRITYNDKKPHVISNRRGYKTRYILPVAYGKTKSGKRAVRAFQTSGSTKRGVPKWKLFLLDNIITWNNGKTSFKQYKDELIKLGLNTSGDKGMTTLYAITPFANNDVQVSQYNNDITPEPITKDDVVPTTASQNPRTNVPKKEPAIFSRQSHSIDNNYNSDYNIEEPKTQPITKTNIGIEQNLETPTVVNNQPGVTSDIKPATTEPITKDDIENNGEGEGNNDIDLRNSDFVKKFNDLNDRMNNLYKNED
jgi:hypothetical protein